MPVRYLNSTTLSTVVYKDSLSVYISYWIPNGALLLNLRKKPEE